MSKPLVILLCAAYTVEQVSLDILQQQIDAINDTGSLTRLKAHYVETQWQIKLLEACLEFHTIDKDLFARARRKLVREIEEISLLAMKRLEIRLYKKIISHARKVHAPEVLQACREILEQERSLAEWIEDNHGGACAPFWVPERISIAA